MAKKVENGDRKKMVRSKPTTIDQEHTTVVENAHAADDDEDRPFMVRVLTVGVSSYLAQKVWIKRKMLTDGWHRHKQNGKMGQEGATKRIKKGKIRVCPDNKYERLDKYN
ncbi:unnamed protein product [Peronospora farinosa]|uniref:Uncharacterized protein n=1 Tax=Peronospora farinosa TaxID=134698 RepID=A0AAV0SR98_9STRA|nr:unnamed protein product [Peronospora farinosa]CAI5706351.1 unnamed protein product [Peronospora farinosa]